jgi:hypothetical protein
MRKTFFSFWLSCAITLASVSAQVVINEMLYDSEPDSQALEFVELFNPGGLAVDLSGWRFTDGIDFTFTNGTQIAAFGFLLVAQDPATLSAVYGAMAEGPWSGSLKNAGEKVTLRDAAGNKIDEVDYQRAFPWPTCPGGASMELINASLDNNIGASWRSSLNPVTDTPVTFLAPAQNDWHYFKGSEEASSPVDAWRALGFVEDANWFTGQTPVGYGDGDDNTTLDDMRNNYSTVYLRHTLVMTNPVPSQLLLRVYTDDGAIVWINGFEVGRPSVSAGDKNYNDFGSNHEAAWEEVLLTNPSAYMTPGVNQVAVHGLNATLGSSDFSIDLELKTVPPGGSNLPTPGATNRGNAANAPPAIRQVKHRPEEPAGGEAVLVSAKVTDPDGVSSVVLAYKDIAPGAYERLTDASFDSGWVLMNMVDDGTGGDVLAGDAVFSARLPGGQHRHLVRYRITVEDGTGLSQQVPYTDDEQPNFAYLVYDGIPAWTAADNPGTSSPQAFSAALMAGSLPVYHLVASEADVLACQYSSGSRNTRFYGTMVYEGKVYDHVQFKVRGEASTYRSGKNKWRFYFNQGRGFEARDDNGKLYPEPLNRMNFNGCSSPWAPVNRGMAGLDEAVSYKMYALAGVSAPNTHFFQFRIIDDGLEAPTDQYAGDLWGLYLMQEQLDGRWLDRLGLPDGNTYKIQGGNGEKRNQAPGQSEDTADWNTFKGSAQSAGTAQAWWEMNLHLHSYFGFRAINRVCSNIDLRNQTNYGMYHHPNGLWRVVPQDLDMMFIPETHWAGEAYMKNALVHAAINIDFKNRARELMDLLCADRSPTGGQAAQVLRELARIVNPAGPALTLADMDQFMWNYHPRTASDHRGRFYVTPFNDSRRGGSWVRTLATADHEGQVQYMLDFMTDTDPGAFAVGDGDQRGYGFNYLELEASDPDVPDRPTIQYTGPVGFPVDDLDFQCSAFSDPNGAGTFQAVQWRLGAIYNDASAGYREGDPWHYEVTPLWEVETGVPLVDSIQPTPAGLVVGRTYRARVRHQDDSGRWSRWSEAVEFVSGPSQGLAAYDDLVLSEIHYNPVDFEDYAFIELMNRGAGPIDLNGLSLSNAVQFTFTTEWLLGAGEYLVMVEDPTAFDLRYRMPSSPYYYPGITVAGPWSGELANGGESIVLNAPGGTELYRVAYSDGGSWPERADGDGSSAELIDPLALSPPRSEFLKSGDHWRSSCRLHGSPGRAGDCLELLVINEVLAHSDAGPALDWVELVNTGDTPVASAGLFLSDDYAQLQKYALSNAIPGGAFRVLDENVLGFAFSELGDDVILTRVSTNGAVTFVDAVDFGPSARDVSFGLHTRSDGETDFTAQRVQTPGAENAYPAVGPLVFRTVLYHPTNGIEYVELMNASDVPVDISTWHLRSAVDFTFPSATELPAWGRVIVCATNAPAFRAAFAVAPSIPVLGPWSGNLNNAGESLRLRRPGDMEPDGTFPYILVDKVDYRPELPWPPAADGTGLPLERIAAYVYGNDPASWQAGSVNPAPDEHLLFSLPAPSAAGQIRLRWSTVPGQQYRIEYSNDLSTGSWIPVQTLVAGSTLWEILEPLGVLLRGYYRVAWEP